MSFDFTYGDSTINSSGGFIPTKKNAPTNPREIVDTYADIANIPNPYVGLTVTVKADETNQNKMTDYKVISLKPNALGIANSVIDRVQRYVDYLGVSTGGTGIDGQDGATFTPSVASDGTLSWTNDKSLPNPTPVNIKGDKGDTGATGANGQDGVTPTLKIGTTTTLSAGSSATVSITKSPTTEEYTIDFGIPKGADGVGGTGLTSEQARQLTIAYEHSQVSHVSLDEVDAKITEATSNVTMLNQNGGTQLLIWAGTQQEYDELLVYDNNTVYLIEGRSSAIVTRYTITNNLTNVSTSNSANSIAEGSSYEAKLSVSTGYNVGNVSITMGGVDITSTCYNNKTITISSVTGNIVITAEAVEITGTDSKYTLAYSLEEETAFDGSSNIETGVKLFDSDKDFTILADFTPSSQSVSGGKQNALFRVKQNKAPWIGVDISNWNEGTTCGSRGSMISQTTKQGYILGKICTGVPRDTTNRLKFAIKRVSADKKMYFYDSQGLIGSYSDAGDVASNPITTTIKLGGHSDSTTNYMPCTVHTFKVYFDAVDDSDITTLLE